MPLALIESLDHEGRGVAHVDGKTIFIEGGLPGEQVEYSSFRKKPSYEQATLTKLLSSSSQRVTPRCPSFGVCGGCSMQHMHPVAQTAAKQRVLEDALWHVGRLRPQVVFPAISGAAWGYRSRARMSVRLVAKKGGVLVGFHEKRSSFVAVMDSCEVLPPAMSVLITPLKKLMIEMSAPDRLPQIEVAMGAHQLAMVFKVLAPPSKSDSQRLIAFAKEHGITAYLQAKGPDSVLRLWPAPDDASASELSYLLPEFAIDMAFRPTDFTQVNHRINEVMIRRAMSLLQPQQGERIADMFCGLGNFTLPIARSGASVFGVEGSASLIQRAGENAVRNGLGQQATYAVANLFEIDGEKLARYGRFDKMLIDPPREGAAELVKALPEEGGPQRIVYVSCNPATLARDAGILVDVKKYRLRGAGVINMFPQTSHVESIALFERDMDS